MDFDKFAYRRKESAFPQLSQADEKTVKAVCDCKVLNSEVHASGRSSNMAFNTTNENQSDTDKKRKRYMDSSDDDGGEVLKRSRRSTCSETEHTKQAKDMVPTTSKSRHNLNALKENCGSEEYENQMLSLACKRKGEMQAEQYDNICKDPEVISILDSEDCDSNYLTTVETCGNQWKNSSKQDDVEVICVSDDSDALVSETIGNDVAVESDDDDNNFSEEEMVMTLSFFNDCSLQEMTSVPGLSAKKAEKIIKLRPFECWNDLVSKLDSAKTLSSQLIDKCQSLFEERKVVENLMNKCEKIANKIQQKLNSRLTANESGGCKQQSRDVIRSQPSMLNDSFQLKPYQLTSLNWLVLMHEQKVNGILADEMGLGKTVQAIAFLAHLSESGEDGPHLIVVPASTLDNWAREFKRWCSSLQCLLYYGSQAERLHLRNKILYYGDVEPDIIITTYSVATGSYEDRSFLRKLDCHYVILDEGHMLKNMQSQRYHCLMKMKARRRLLLTGTPLQNNLLELMSLLSFVMPQMFGESVQGIKLLFSNCRTNDQPGSNYEKETLAQAKRIMKPFVLRRLKKDVLQQLPVKREHVIHCDLTEDQRRLYNEIFLNCSQQFRPSGQDSQCSNILMMLRKASNHPLLLRKHYNDSTLLEMSQEYCKDPAHRDAEANIVFEDMTVMSDFELHRLCREERRLASHCLSNEVIVKSGKFLYLDFLLPELKQKKCRVLLFSQFTMVMDIIEVYLSDRRHRYLRLDGQTSVVERQNLIDKYHGDPDIFIFLLSTRAGGLGINLTSANVVILHDIDFNPYNDKQAEDRCHRVGQTRDVDVFRLISKDTIDEAILRCAQNKLQLEHDMAASDKDNEASPKDVLELLNEAFNSFCPN